MCFTSQGFIVKIIFLLSKQCNITLQLETLYKGFGAKLKVCIPIAQFYITISIISVFLFLFCKEILLACS